MEHQGSSENDWTLEMDCEELPANYKLPPYLTPQRKEPELEPQPERHEIVTPDSPTHNTQETVETGVDHDFNRPPYPVEFSLVGCDINDPPENVSELGDMDVDKVEENEFDEVDIDDEHPVEVYYRIKIAFTS